MKTPKPVANANQHNAEPTPYSNSSYGAPPATTGPSPPPFVHIVFSQQLAETLLNDLADNDPQAQTRWDPGTEEETGTENRADPNNRVSSTGDSISDSKPRAPDTAGPPITPESPPHPAVQPVSAPSTSGGPTCRERLPIDSRDIDKRCELGNGIPIHPRWALYTMAAATLRRLVLTTENEATNLSRKVRSFPPHLKLALLAAARGRCTVIGCDSPAPWLEADHVHPWNHQGETDITRNGQILCSHHNKIKRDTIPQQEPPDG